MLIPEAMAKIEVCTGSLNSAIAAQKGGAHRIELCDNLYEGGTTPSYGMIKKATELLDIPIHVIIRPRGGDFCYNDEEFDVMVEDIKMCKDHNVDGVVIGLLNPDGTIDVEKSGKLVKIARPMSVTFHRAFDMTPDPFNALSSLIKIGVDRVLTSGQKDSAIDGAKLLNELIERAENDIIIMPGGGLTDENISNFANIVKTSEYHATLRSPVKSKMIYKNHEVSMGGLPQIPEFDIKETDPVKVANFAKILKEI